MADVSTFSGFLIYSHIIPVIMGFFSIIVLANGIMDKRLEYTIGGVALFFFAAIFPFITLPYVLGI